MGAIEQLGQPDHIHLINFVRGLDIGFAFSAVIMLLPFRGMKRLHPLLYPALVLLIGYNLVNLFTEIGRWNAVITWRLPCNFIFAVVSLWFGWVVSRISTQKKTKIPFTGRWVVPYTGQSIVTDKGQQVVYAPQDKTDFKPET